MANTPPKNKGVTSLNDNKAPSLNRRQLAATEVEKITTEVWIQTGHKKRPSLGVIRTFCIDCSGGNPREVRKCEHLECSLWPYRTGTNPFRKRESNDA